MSWLSWGQNQQHRPTRLLHCPVSCSDPMEACSDPWRGRTWKRYVATGRTSRSTRRPIREQVANAVVQERAMPLLQTTRRPYVPSRHALILLMVALLVTPIWGCSERGDEEIQSQRESTNSAAPSETPSFARCDREDPRPHRPEVALPGYATRCVAIIRSGSRTALVIAGLLFRSHPSLSFMKE